VHDLGHPPFGPPEKKRSTRPCASTAIVRSQLARAADCRGLRTSLRVVRGLNLTFEVREGIIKHSHDYAAKDYPELSEYLLDERPPLEAQLIDLTDEIAYSTADLDDGYEARLLTVEQIARAWTVPTSHSRRQKPLPECRREAWCLTRR